MASLSEDPGKRGKTYRVSFTDTAGKRKAVRLGAMPRKSAETIRAHIDRLESCLFDGSAPPPATAAWLAEVSDTLRKRMEKTGLVAAASEAPALPTVAGLIVEFKDRPKWRSLKPTSSSACSYAFGYLIPKIGAQVIDAVTEIDAENFRDYLTESKPTGAGLARASANRICANASALFRYAIKSRRLSVNPFDAVERGNVATTRRAFVDADTVRRVINATYGTEMRLLIAMSRWAGLRVPSEPRLLRWRDIDWEGDRINVTSPKTERHEGHGSRIVPLFPEIRPYLDARWSEAEDGEEFVFPTIRHLSPSGFRSAVKRAWKRAKIEPWPRVFHNMRSTRQTELENSFPSHVVCAWLGNSEEIARKHYLQVTDSHFEKAAQNPAQSASAEASQGATKQSPETGEVPESRPLAEGV